MAAVDYQQQPGVKLSELWVDKRSRGVIIQIIALILLLLFIGYIVNNTISNLKLLGIETGYGFLEEPSNYDINQRPIEYSSRSSHGRALWLAFSTPPSLPSLASSWRRSSGSSRAC